MIRHTTCLVAAAALAGCLQSASPPDSAAGGVGAATVEAVPPAVRLAALDAPRPQRIVSGRDPFRFAARETTRAPDGFDGPRGTHAAAGAVSPAVPGAALAAPAAERGEDSPAVRFIALSDEPRHSGRIAVLLVDGKVVQGRSGDVLDDGSIRILRIDTEAVEIELTETAERQVVQLDGT